MGARVMQRKWSVAQPAGRTARRPGRQRRATAARTPVAPRAQARRSSLRLLGIEHPRIGVDRVQPGDICFQLKMCRKTWRQHLITTAQRFFNFHSAGDNSDPHILHTFVVLAVDPRNNRMTVADASGGTTPTTEVSQVEMDFSYRTRDPHLDPYGATLVYRIGDARFRRELTRIAAAWTTGGFANFSIPHGVLATFRPHGLRHANAAHHVSRMVRHAYRTSAIPGEDGKQYHLMCSELVAGAAAAAVLTCHQADHGGRALKGHELLPALEHGCVGNTFAVCPTAVLPSALHARVARSAHTRVVGFIPSERPLLPR